MILFRELKNKMYIDPREVTHILVYLNKLTWLGKISWSTYFITAFNWLEICMLNKEKQHFLHPVTLVWKILFLYQLEKL